MTQLSKHFTLDELTSERDSVPPSAAHVENLRKLCETALEPLRAALGRPLFVSSGYRSETYNRKIGGASGSQHCLGIAADLELGTDEDCIRAAALASKIASIGGIGIYPGRGFIHVDIRPRANGKPRWWAQVKGAYGPLPESVRASLTKAGVKF